MHWRFIGHTQKRMVPFPFHAFHYLFRYTAVFNVSFIPTGPSFILFCLFYFKYVFGIPLRKNGPARPMVLLCIICIVVCNVYFHAMPLIDHESYSNARKILGRAFFSHQILERTLTEKVQLQDLLNSYQEGPIGWLRFIATSNTNSI